MIQRQDTIIGELPNDWEVGLFSEDLKIQGRIGWKGYTKSDLVESGPIVIGGTEIKSSIHLRLENVKHLSRNKYDESPEIMLKHGDVLLVTRGNLGEVGYYHESYGEGTINPSVIILKEFIGDSKFLFYYLISRGGNHQVLSLTSGSSIPAIYQSEVYQLYYPRPSLIEQKAIAQVLTAFDDKIENLKAQNQTLETLAQTIFKEWFGKESDDWELVEIDILIHVSSSKRIYSREYVTDGIPFYRSKEVIELSTKPDITTELYISEERFKQIKEMYDVPQKGDILLTAVGTLGVPFQVRDYSPFYFKDGNLIWFKNFKNTITSDFVYNWLKLKSTQDQLNMISIGSTQKALTIASVKELKIPFIKDEIKRNNFYRLLKSNLDKVNHNLAHIQSLTKTRDTLLPKLMSGELRVEGFGG